jgi:hypothetical protein
MCAGWRQGRRREEVIQILADQRRLDHDVSVVVERRHDTLRVDRQVPRGILLAAKQIDVMRLVLKLLLGERDQHLLCAYRIVGRVELEHWCCLGCVTLLDHGSAD